MPESRKPVPYSELVQRGKGAMTGNVIETPTHDLYVKVWDKDSAEETFIRVQFILAGHGLIPSDSPAIVGHLYRDDIDS